MYDLGSSKWINQAKAVYVTVNNTQFNPGVFTGTVPGSVCYPVATKYDVIDGSMNIRGVAYNVLGATAFSTRIFDIPGVLPPPAFEMPFICTVGVNANTTVGYGAVKASGEVWIYYYLDSAGAKTLGFPAGDIDLSQIPTWYF